MPTFQARSRLPRENTELTEDELMLTSPVIYGFSLSDKTWCTFPMFFRKHQDSIADYLSGTVEFNTEHVQPIAWNDEAFEQLVIPPKHKQVLQTLVESHNAGASKKFDDFVTGKGHGLVINLFGNPGTGKSLTAEAMSECTSRFVSLCCSYAHSA